jgi:LPS O-antigen subunit length determinant protein (WzzB/FepE family)
MEIGTSWTLCARFCAVTTISSRAKDSSAIVWPVRTKIIAEANVAFLNTLQLISTLLNRYICVEKLLILELDATNNTKYRYIYDINSKTTLAESPGQAIIVIFITILGNEKQKCAFVKIYVLYLSQYSLGEVTHAGSGLHQQANPQSTHPAT